MSGRLWQAGLLGGMTVSPMTSTVTLVAAWSVPISFAKAGDGVADNAVRSSSRESRSSSSRAWSVLLVYFCTSF